MGYLGRKVEKDAIHKIIEEANNVTRFKKCFCPGCIQLPYGNE